MADKADQTLDSGVSSACRSIAALPCGSCVVHITTVVFRCFCNWNSSLHYLVLYLVARYTTKWQNQPCGRVYHADLGSVYSDLSTNAWG